jgi:flagellar motor switch protein FliG
MDTSEKFDNFISGLDVMFIKNNIHRIDKIKVAKSLKTTDPAKYRAILSNISENYLNEIENIMKNMGPVKLNEIENVQKEIMDMVN